MQPSLLRDRDFRLVASAVGLSALGDWVAIVALGLHVKELTDSGFAVAALWVCLFGPSVLVAGHVGLLVDRVEATRLLAVVSVAGTALAAIVAFADALAPVLILTAALGVVFATSQPAEFSLVPPLAGNARIQEANGHIETARYIGFGIGPLLGGLLFAAGGSSWRCWSMRPPSPPSRWQRSPCASAATPRRWRRRIERRAPATASRSSSATACCAW